MEGSGGGKRVVASLILACFGVSRGFFCSVFLLFYILYAEISKGISFITSVSKTVSTSVDYCPFCSLVQLPFVL